MERTLNNIQDCINKFVELLDEAFVSLNKKVDRVEAKLDRLLAKLSR